VFLLFAARTFGSEAVRRPRCRAKKFSSVDEIDVVLQKPCGEDQSPSNRTASRAKASPQRWQEKQSKLT